MEQKKVLETLDNILVGILGLPMALSIDTLAKLAKHCQDQTPLSFLLIQGISMLVGYGLIAYLLIFVFLHIPVYLREKALLALTLGLLAFADLLIMMFIAVYDFPGSEGSDFALYATLFLLLTISLVVIVWLIWPDIDKGRPLLQSGTKLAVLLYSLSYVVVYYTIISLPAGG